MDIDKIKKSVEKALKSNVFPGCGVAIYNKGEIYSFVRGYTSYEKKEYIEEDTLFDLASLSKPLATTLASLALIKEGKINYKMTLASLLGCRIPADKKDINLAQLLSHSAGFVAHGEFYKKLIELPLDERKNKLLQYILQAPLSAKPGTKVIYSDLGFVLLFLIIEFQAQECLETFVYNRIFTPMNIKNVCYRPKEKGYTRFAATEQCLWRKKEIVGEVHDQNTWILDGVSGQAGLFGDLDSVFSLVLYIKDMVQGKKDHPYINRGLLQEAVIRRNIPQGNYWGLGFDTPSQPGSSAGKFISEKSCGHLGFTGTSFWIEFDQDISVVLLTNRINPTVDNIKIRDFRPLFHDLVFKN